MLFGRKHHRYLKGLHAWELWAAWTPSEQILEPGRIGHFDENLQFNSAQQATLAYHGIAMQLSPEAALASTFYADENAGDWRIGTHGKAKVPLGHIPITADVNGRVILQSHAKQAWMLQLRNPTECHITNDEEVFLQVRDRVLDGKWQIDDYVVTRRIRAQEGFALVCYKKGIELAFDVGVGAKVAGVIDLVNAGLAPGYHGGISGYGLYPFAGPAGYQIPTPTFSAPIGLNQKLWGKLVPHGKKRGLEVSNAARTWFDISPVNLQNLPPEERLYQAGAPGVLTPEEIQAMPLWELFRPIGDIGWKQTTVQWLSRLDHVVEKRRREKEPANM